MDSQLLDQACEGLIAELDVVSLAEYFDALVAYQPGVVLIRGQVHISALQIEVYPDYGEELVLHLWSIVVEPDDFVQLLVSGPVGRK